jgi:large subunit ribosomal protein L29
MKAADLRRLSPDELAAKLKDLRQGLFNQRLKKQTGQLENTATLRSGRRELARALTVCREKGGAA